MKGIKQKRIALLLCFVLAFGMSITASARASHYIDSVNAFVTAVGSGSLRIKLTVIGTKTMTELGFDKVIVYEKKSDGNYQPVRTITKESDPTLFTKNRVSHTVYISHHGTPGKYYYVTAHCYAKDVSGSSGTWIGSNAAKA